MVVLVTVIRVVGIVCIIVGLLVTIIGFLGTALADWDEIGCLWGVGLLVIGVGLEFLASYI